MRRSIALAAVATLALATTSLTAEDNKPAAPQSEARDAYDVIVRFFRQNLK